MQNEQSLLGVTSQSFIKSNTQVAEPPTKDRHTKKGGNEVTVHLHRVAEGRHVRHLGYYFL